MRPTDSARPVKPGSPRYATVDVEDHGPHVFRGPTYALAQALGELTSYALAQAVTPEGTMSRMEEISPMMGAVVGACWWHPELDLEASKPGWGASPVEWMTYGEQVADEMVEQGYTLAHLMTLYGTAADLVLALRPVMEEAEDRRDFSSGPGAEANPEPTAEAPAPA